MRAKRRAKATTSNISSKNRKVVIDMDGYRLGEGEKKDHMHNKEKYEEQEQEYEELEQEEEEEEEYQEHKEEKEGDDCIDKVGDYVQKHSPSLSTTLCFSSSPPKLKVAFKAQNCSYKGGGGDVLSEQDHLPGALVSGPVNSTAEKSIGKKNKRYHRLAEIPDDAVILCLDEDACEDNNMGGNVDLKNQNQSRNQNRNIFSFEVAVGRKLEGGTQQPSSGAAAEKMELAMDQSEQTDLNSRKKQSRTKAKTKTTTTRNDDGAPFSTETKATNAIVETMTNRNQAIVLESVLESEEEVDDVQHPVIDLLLQDDEDEEEKEEIQDREGGKARRRDYNEFVVKNKKSECDKDEDQLSYNLNYNIATPVTAEVETDIVVIDLPEDDNEGDGDDNDGGKRVSAMTAATATVMTRLANSSTRPIVTGGSYGTYIDEEENNDMEGVMTSSLSATSAFQQQRTRDGVGRMEIIGVGRNVTPLIKGPTVQDQQVLMEAAKASLTDWATDKEASGLGNFDSRASLAVDGESEDEEQLKMQMKQPEAMFAARDMKSQINHHDDDEVGAEEEGEDEDDDDKDEETQILSSILEVFPDCDLRHAVRLCRQYETEEVDVDQDDSNHIDQNNAPLPQKKRGRKKEKKHGLISDENLSIKLTAIIEHLSEYDYPKQIIKKEGGASKTTSTKRKRTILNAAKDDGRRNNIDSFDSTSWEADSVYRKEAVHLLLIDFPFLSKYGATKLFRRGKELYELSHKLACEALHRAATGDGDRIGENRVEGAGIGGKEACFVTAAAFSLDPRVSSLVDGCGGCGGGEERKKKHPALTVAQRYSVEQLILSNDETNEKKIDGRGDDHGPDRGGGMHVKAKQGMTSSSSSSSTSRKSIWKKGKSVSTHYTTTINHLTSNMLLKEYEHVRDRMKCIQEEQNLMMARIKAREEAKKSEATFECQCCYASDFAFEEMCQCHEEGHLFCLDCLRRYAEEQLFGLNRPEDLKCMYQGENGVGGREGEGCQSGFDDIQLKRALPSRIYKKLEEAKARNAVEKAGIENLCTCPKCDYQVILPSPEKILRCPNTQCQHESCRYCGRKPHLPLKCNEEREDRADTVGRTKVEEAMANAKIRQCPKCQRRFYKEEGCNKMKCSCGTAICYVCRENISSTGYSHFCQRPHCNHKTCKMCPLYSNSMEEDQKAVKKAGMEAAKEALKFFPCQDKICEHAEDVLDIDKSNSNRSSKFKASIDALLYSSSSTSFFTNAKETASHCLPGTRPVLVPPVARARARTTAAVERCEQSAQNDPLEGGWAAETTGASEDRAVVAGRGRKPRGPVAGGWGAKETVLVTRYDGGNDGVENHGSRGRKDLDPPHKGDRAANATGVRRGWGPMTTATSTTVRNCQGWGRGTKTGDWGALTARKTGWGGEPTIRSRRESGEGGKRAIAYDWGDWGRTRGSGTKDDSGQRSTTTKDAWVGGGEGALSGGSSFISPASHRFSSCSRRQQQQNTRSGSGDRDDLSRMEEEESLRERRHGNVERFAGVDDSTHVRRLAHVVGAAANLSRELRSLNEDLERERRRRGAPNDHIREKQGHGHGKWGK